MGTSLVVQWLRFQAPNAVGERPGFHPWSGNWISHATTKTQHSQIKKKKTQAIALMITNILGYFVQLK